MTGTSQARYRHPGFTGIHRKATTTILIAQMATVYGSQFEFFKKPREDWGMPVKDYR